ncbi:hypothetical protein Q4561_19075 [Alteromonas sp. 1_MG-2023]|uniref:hypothetical protein n=1 Tax=Alteromonas sp. 1_MG-2023 TaxID=3062669 RepID=UPI0026E32E3C|nr:hypothetical protein [Alteromonas sp. 1_MG-2023]MDO6569181.1 hypothetical protein [Alteromonas sp. 1_MG-2023]
MRSLSYLFIFSITIFLVGCFGDNTIEFNPEVGESRHYHTIQEVEISTPGRGSENMRLDSYATFEITENKADSINVHISPGKVETDIGSRTFSTSVEGGFPAELLGEQGAGADMVINSQSGEMIDVKTAGNSLRDSLTNVLGNSVGKLLNHVSQPNIAVPISPNKGWTNTTEFRGVSNVEFKVTKVSDSKVWIEFQGGKERNRLAGLAVIDKASGWVEHQVLTSSSQHTISGKEIGIRSTEVLARVVDGKEAYVPTMRTKWANRWLDIVESAQTQKVEAASDLAKVFSDPDGQLIQKKDELSLELNHALSKNVFLGNVEFSEPLVFDKNDELINQPIHIGPTFSHNQYREEGKVSTAQIHFTGAGGLTESIKQAASVRAKIAWYPDESFITNVSIDQNQKAHYEDNGVIINFSLVDSGAVDHTGSENGKQNSDRENSGRQDNSGQDTHNNEYQENESKQTNKGPQTTSGKSNADNVKIYELTFEGQENDRLNFELGEGQAYDVQYHAYPNPPQWLTAEESNTRYQASAHTEAHKVLIRTKEQPSSLNIIVYRAAKEPAEVRDIVFLTEEAKRFSSTRKPETNYLYESDTPHVGAENLKPKGIEKGQVELVLGNAQIDVCTATLSPKAEEAGNALVFKPVFNNKSFIKPASLLLQTEDGIRQYFYGLGAREVTLSCSQTQQWVDSNLKLDAETPWVVAIEDLTAINREKGENKNEDTHTVGDILSRYRFLDAEGRVLSLVTINQDVTLSPSTEIEDVLFPHNTLRIAGEPVGVQEIRMSDTPINKTFNITFLNLPTGSDE